MQNAFAMQSCSLMEDGTMTEQISDVIMIDGVKRSVMGILQMDSRVLIRKPDAWGIRSSCWREYVATWEVRDSMVWLNELEGNFKLGTDTPMLALWMTDTFRVVNSDRRYTSYSGNVRYASVLEFLVVRGRVIRQRELRAVSSEAEDWVSWYTPSWLALPEAEALIPMACRPEVHKHRLTGYYSQAPVYGPFNGMHLRERIKEARITMGLGYGDVMERAGHSKGKGSYLLECEQGWRVYNERIEKEICAVLGIPEEERLAIRARERADYAKAWNAWADEPITPALYVDQDYGDFCYLVPEEHRGDPLAMEQWAEACVNFIWHPARLVISRRRAIHYSRTGQKLKEVITEDGVEQSRS